MPRLTNAPDLTPHQAKYVLHRLLQDGRINGSDVRKAVDGMQREITELEQKLADLRTSSGGGGERTASRGRQSASRTRPAARPRRTNMSPQVIASRKVQGQYIGYMRQLPEKDRGKYAEMAKSKGREAAITAMKKALGK
jgi:hypothetical protein